jgi:hypothetical protein
VTRRSLPLLLALLVVAGCGAADLKSESPDTSPCPAGVRQLKVKDILPEPPPGFEIIAADPNEVAARRDALRQQVGARLRSLRARKVIKPGDVTGTLVFVVNNTERFDPRNLLLGADQIAEQVNAEAQPLTIAGQDGLIAAGPSVVLASGAAGECAGVTLVGDTEPDVRAIAAKLRRAQ